MGQIMADLTRTCKGCEDVVSDLWDKGKGTLCYRCGADGPRKGYMVGKAGRFEPWIPAWCPRLIRERRENHAG